MDDEDLANLLRNHSSSTSALPGFYASNNDSQQDDPFANPFANPFATDEPAFQHTPVFEPTNAASDSPYSRHLEENVIESYDAGQPAQNVEAPWGEQPASDLYNDAPLVASINKPPPTSFEDTLYSSAHVRPAEQAAVPSSYQFEDPYRINDSQSFASTSATRIQPNPDILGLLPEQDPTEDLKKAFKPTEPAEKDTSNPLSDSPRSAVTASPYVFRPGGSSSKKKGITFDSVQRERERKREQTLREEEARKIREEELRKAEEANKLSTQAEEDKATLKLAGTIVSPDAPASPDKEGEVEHSSTAGDTDQAQHDTVLERAAKEAETLSQPGPAIPTTVAEQILNSEHPDQAAQHIAQLIAEKDRNGSGDTVAMFDRDPALLPLPESRADTPVQQDKPTVEAKLIDSALPLDEDKSAPEPLFSALSIGGSSESANGNAENTYGSTANPSRNSRWGRAFEDQGDVEDSSHASTIQGAGWTTDIGSLNSAAGPLSYDNSQAAMPWGGVESSLVVDTAVDQYVEQADMIESPKQSVTRSPTEVRSPTRNRLLTQPVFSISVSDPTKVGDPVRGYIVYTVTTRTTSPHYRRGEFSVLRRFSDFLWLAEAVSNNNPGVIVPPLPDKHAFGRFEEQFVETRRAALERTVGKMANHPVLSLDPDLKLFLSSEAFSIDVKHRRQEMTQEKQGVLSSISGSIGGPRYTEQDSWFDVQKNFLDNLELQIKALTRCLESTSRQRLELAHSFASIAETLQQLAESDLSMALSQVLHQFSVLSNQEREMQEDQAKLEVTRLLNLADEHVRLIGSVRSAFAARIKTYFNWQNAEAEARRIKVQFERERVKKGGKYAPDRSSIVDTETSQAERRVIDAQSDFEAVSRLIKLEYGRFEQERVEDFKSALERYVQGACESQRELVAVWEKFHGELGELVGQAGPARS